MTENDKSLKLAPCPFCGGKAVFTERYRGIRINCTNRNEEQNDIFLCPMNMRTHHHQTEREAAEAWNTRHTDKVRGC